MRGFLHSSLLIRYNDDVSIGNWIKKAVKNFGSAKKPHAFLKQAKIKDDGSIKSLVSEQRDLSNRFEALMSRLENSLDSMSSTIKSLNVNDRRILENLRKKQEGLRLAMTRLEAALSNRSDVERELVGWKRALENTDRKDCLRASLKAEIFRSEATIRSAIESGRPIEVQSASVARETAVIPSKIVHTATEELPQQADIEFKPRIARAEAKHLTPEAAHIVRSIRELSNELARHEQSPVPNQKEMASVTRQIRDLHVVLRKIDKKFGKIRDRIEMTDGFRRVFQHH